MKITTLLSITLLIVQFNTFGQIKQKTADRYFANKEYSKCVQMYDELAAKCDKKPSKCQEANIRKAAVSHYFIYEMKQSVAYFSKLKKANTLTEQDQVYFIEALRYSGNYTDAEAQINEAHIKFPENMYVSKMFSDKSKFNGLFADSASYSIGKTNIESIYGDFSPTFFKNGIVYATKSKNTEVLRGKYGWDDAYYVSLLQSPLVDDSVYNNGKLLKNKFLSKAHDGPVDFNTEENQMVITKNTIGRKKGNSVVVLALYFSTFDGKKWTDLVPFEYNSAEYNVGHGCFSEDGKKLYFSSDMPGGIGGADIYVSNLENGKWSKPENLGSTINTDKNELFPFVNDNSLFFASNGHYGVGGLDLFEASLISKTVQNMGYPVNSSADDFALITDSTGNFGYFSSNRKNNIDGIYQFDKKDVYLDVIVQVFEKYDIDEIVPTQPITLKNKLSGEEEEYFSDANGQLKLRVRQNETYSFVTNKKDFKLKEEVELNTKTTIKDTTFECNLYLLPTKITIALKVVSKDTKKALEGASTTIPKFINGQDTVMVTNKNGLVTINVDRNKDYLALGSKKGFIDDRKSFNTSNEDGKIIELQLELTPIKKGEKFQLDDIFYDLNKSTLRPESAASLDKLADFILKNDLSIELSSHTDARGSDPYNQKLSQARAQSCVNYLLTKGVKTSMMKAKGYGESQLINRCKNGVTCTEEEHQENRRTEVKILNY